MKCLECKKDLEQTPGKRVKQFCNSTCRSNFWQKEKRKSTATQNKAKSAPKTHAGDKKYHKHIELPENKQKNKPAANVTDLNNPPSGSSKPYNPFDNPRFKNKI